MEKLKAKRIGEITLYAVDDRILLMFLRNLGSTKT
jgi:hypothetical protein